MRSHKLLSKEPTTHPDFTEVPFESEDFDFAVRTWGGDAWCGQNHLLRLGKTFNPTELKQHTNPKSRNEFYWTKYKSNNPLAYEVMSSVTFDDVIWMTTGTPCISGYITINGYVMSKKRLQK